MYMYVYACPPPALERCTITTPPLKMKQQIDVVMMLRK